MFLNPSRRIFFQLLPLLVHENIDMPETCQIPSSAPCGVADYLPPKETERVGRKYLGPDNVIIRRHPEPQILAVYSIGQCGISCPDCRIRH